MQIENYIKISTGRGKNLIGQVFGDYKVIYRTEVPVTSNSKQAHWLCQCQICNKYIVKPAYTLSHGENKCNCRENLVGQKIGRWTVKYLCEERTAKRGKIYHCICNCGNEKDVPAETLKRGESKSCGCYAKEVSAKIGGKNKIDLTGQRFGKLVALYSNGNAKGGHTAWHCKCDCGNEVDVDLGNLRQGFSKSCGCTMSSNEERIIKLLTINGIKFDYQYTAPNLKTMRYDFYIFNSLGEDYLIEFDGQQHFKYTGTGWDTKGAFEERRKRDLIKNQYCFEHNIPLIRIPYNKNYDLNDLKLETTRFLLTKENEMEYYDNKKN